MTGVCVDARLFCARPHFTLQFVCNAACISIPAQRSSPPFACLDKQFMVG